MDAAQLSEAVERIQRERNELRTLMASVLGSVIEDLTDGSVIAHIPARIVDEIRHRLGLGL